MPQGVVKNNRAGASLVAQWLRICPPMRGTRVRALVWEDPTCRRAAGPASHNCWACASGACAPQQERPRWWEARAPRWRVAPGLRNWRRPSHRSEDPTQPLKKKKKIEQSAGNQWSLTGEYDQGKRQRALLLLSSQGDCAHVKSCSLWGATSMKQ